MQNKIIPFFRDAILVKVDPTPNLEQASQILSALKEKWSTLKVQYKDILAELTKVAFEDIKIGPYEYTRIRREADTQILDFPRLIYQGDTKAFEARVCIAICTGDMSTKVLARCGTPIINNVRFSYSTDDMPVVNKLFDRITKNLTEWMKQELQNIIRQNLDILSISDNGSLEVSTYGIKDEKIADFFNELQETPVRISELLRDENAKEVVSYYEKLTDLGNISDYTIGSKSEFYNWYTSRVLIDVESGYIEPREVLYLYKKDKDVNQFIGIGYDDSLDGDLSPMSSLKIATYFVRKEPQLT